MEYGQLMVTAGIAQQMERDPAFCYGIAAAFTRYIAGVWGEVCREDWQLNDRSVREGERVLGAYDVAGRRVWIITEWDRSATTILFPDEY